jgi:hypothetical protein
MKLKHIVKELQKSKPLQVKDLPFHTSSLLADIFHLYIIKVLFKFNNNVDRYIHK